MSEIVAPAPVRAKSATEQPADDQEVILTPVATEGGAVICSASVQARTIPEWRKSPTLLTLYVRSRHGYFKGGRIAAAQLNGFTWGKTIHHLVLPHPDTGETIAFMEVHGGREAFGTLEEIEVHCDHARCAAHSWAGSMLMRSLVAFATAMDADVCDGLGKVLSEDEREAFALHLNSLLSKREDEAHPPPVKLSKTTTRHFGLLSFQHFDHIKEPGKRLRVVAEHFPAKATEYHEGAAEGYRRAAEVVQYLRTHKISRPNLQQMLAEALSQGRGSFFRKSKGNIASAFLDAIELLIVQGAKQMHPSQFEASADRHAAEAKRIAFTKRMKAAKAAKKAQREGGAA